MPSTSQFGGRRVGPWAILLALIALAVAFALPASASAASCPVTPGVFATAWIGGSGSLHSDANWTNGTPSGSCDVSITAAGDYTVSMTGGANAKSLVLGGVGSTPHLVISDESPNTNFDAQPAGITIAAGASVTLTCQPGGCPGGGPDIYSGPSPFANAGTITVGSNTGGGAVVGGQITNTGTIDFDQSGSLSGVIVNQNLISIANGATAANQGSSCGDTGASVKNDTGGSISTEGTGVLSAINYEQGNGSTSGNPVRVPCGSVKYTGNGASSVRATGGFALSGEMQAGQSLTVSAESSNTNAVLQGNFTSKGSITLTCPEGCGSSGAGFNVNDKDFVNAGTFTVAAASGTGASVGPNHEGTLTNTGTMNFQQSAALTGPVINKGAIEIANEKVATSSGSSCGDTGASVKNDTGGSIDGIGSGYLSVLNYEQGAGTTSGTLPVRIPCGTLKYTGTGASVVQANASMTGNIAGGQTLRIAGQVNNGAFANAGTIVLDQVSSTLTTGTLTNTGTISGVGTINGTVENTGGVVSPGASPGTLTVNGNYTQGTGGRLEIEIAGTGAGQFDVLAVGGNATIAGALSLILTGSYPSAAAIGDSVAFLPYGGSFSGGFTATTVEPSLACPKFLTVSNDTGAKALQAVVTDGGMSCGGGGGGADNGGSGTTPPPPPPPAPVPNTKLGVHPGPRVTTKLAKLKVKFGFSSDVAGATFQCKLDKGPYKACKSPKTYKVKPGKHKFSVRAVGPGGTDATPATYRFKVIRQKS